MEAFEPGLNGSGAARANGARANGDRTIETRANVGLLYKACEAFWRDVKYAVMARDYRLVKELSAELQKAGDEARALDDPSPLHRWLSQVKRIEAEPITPSGLKNTVYHLLGYWKRELSAEERQRLSDRTMTDATSVLSELKVRLNELSNAYLQTSYIWTDARWDKAAFITNGRQWIILLGRNGEVKVSPIDSAGQVEWEQARENEGKENKREPKRKP